MEGRRLRAGQPITPMEFDELSDEDGALVEPAAVAGYGLERARVEGGDTVLVTGATGSGTLAGLYSSK